MRSATRRLQWAAAELFPEKSQLELGVKRRKQKSRNENSLPMWDDESSVVYMGAMAK